MINAGHIRQDAEQEIVLNAAQGVQRFGVGLPPQQIEPREEVVQDSNVNILGDNE